MSRTLDDLLARAAAVPRALSQDEIAALLSVTDHEGVAALFAAARAVRLRVGREATLPRGLIECSNVCAKDCLYCGIRLSADVPRYRLTEEDVLACVGEARRRGYPAVAFQAGEIESEANTRLYERLVAASAPLEVTLSLGEQTEAVYRRWKAAAGGRTLRYLIRIETSNRELYAKIHPATCSFDRRLGCIRTLKRLGYVTGSGVMIGLPGQSIADLAADVVFFGAENLDMVGMGPFIPAPGTPLSAFNLQPSTFDLALRMIAVTRLYLHAVNIVAATSLEALDPVGREKGLAAGANVIMPNLTPDVARDRYRLYPGHADCMSGA